MASVFCLKVCLRREGEGQERTGRRKGNLDEAGTKAPFLGRVCSRTKNVSVKEATQSPSLMDRVGRKEGYAQK